MKLRTTRLKLRTTRYSVLALVAGALFSLGACGGGINDPVAMKEDPPPDEIVPVELPDVPMPVAFDLPEGNTLKPGDLTISAGMSATRGGVVFTCEGEAACVVVVTESLGTLVAEYTGGMLTAEPVEKPTPVEMAAINLPPGNGLTPAMYVGEFTVPAGGSETRGGTVFTCPSDGGECTVILTNRAGVVAASGTGGVSASLVLDVLQPGGGGGQQPPVPRAENNPLVVEGIKKNTLLDAIDEDGKDGGAVKGYTFAAGVDLKVDDQVKVTWRSGVFTKDAGGNIGEVLRLYSNREPGVPFATAYGERDGDSNDITSGELGAYSFWMLAANAVAEKDEDQRQHFPVTGGPEIIEPVSFMRNKNVPGTFNGVGGNFKCTSGACVVSVGEDDYLIGTGSWTFTAKDPTNTISKDHDYIVFGWWDGGPTDQKGDADETKERTGFRAFFVGNDPFSVDVLPLTGKATYTGKAAGRYSNREVGLPSAANAITWGVFSADATITADFNTDKIEGTVDAFDDPVDAITDPAVVLTLMETSLSNANTFNGDLEGNVNGRTGVTGEWNGQFFGNGETQPTGVAGEFTGRQGSKTGDDGFFSVAGAFGANK